MRKRSLMISKLKLSSGGFMKTSVKLVSCLLFFTLLMTISCSSPQTTETKSVAPENELVGVWKVAEVTFTGPEAKTITAQRNQGRVSLSSRRSMCHMQPRPPELHYRKSLQMPNLLLHLWLSVQILQRMR
jgi:hypothetical protein